MRFSAIICFLLIWSSFVLAEPHVSCHQKWKEMEIEGMKIRLYRLRAQAFPHGKSYKLFVRNVDGSTTETFCYIANPKGHLILTEPEDVKLAAPYIVTPLRRGEKVSYGMVSIDGDQEYAIEMIPFPNEIVKGKLKMAIELADVDGKEFICRGSGFKPNEPLHFEYTFAQEQRSYSCVAGSEGSFMFPMQLSGVLEDSKEAAMKLTYANGRLDLTFPWGRQASEFVGASCLEIK
ncbi:MAG: hypothetical protein K2P51_01455 [Rhabdochlamydiaceae bacterium]|nr:hypothetical protein [Rhabdochlamydiaceae bacterium]